ncbi:MAG: 23S rRNA (guanosine(2251)-2'-O)-methyltransferase RlmB [Candidatus Eutrophobiaceae bacterium]
MSCLPSNEPEQDKVMEEEATLKACGIGDCQALLNDANVEIVQLWFNRESRLSKLSNLRECATKQGLSCTDTSRHELDLLSGFMRHQGVVLEYQRRDWDIRSLDLLIEKGSTQQSVLTLILDHVQDPRNLGACLRSAEGAGVDAVIVPKARAVGLTATVAHVSKGAWERLPVLMESNLAHAIQRLRRAGFQIVGATHDADATLWEQSYTLPMALVLGGESSGLSPSIRQLCDSLVHIPMLGGISCLNVAVACGISLYEVRRQVGQKSSTLIAEAEAAIQGNEPA